MLRGCLDAGAHDIGDGGAWRHPPRLNEEAATMGDKGPGSKSKGKKPKSGKKT
jgi:hypothetical protein